METLRIWNQKKSGYLFHYAHFLCDALFTTFTSNPDAVKHKKKFVRSEHPEQTLGIFTGVYERILNCIVEEYQTQRFEKDEEFTRINTPGREDLFNATTLNSFRGFIFSKVAETRGEIERYPEILLIKRKTHQLVSGPRMEALLDSYSAFIDKHKENEKWENVATVGDLRKNGAERREINRIETLSNILKELYGNAYKSVFLEDLEFEQQVAYFSQARVIICAHGAAISNMMFANPLSTLVEVNEFNGTIKQYPFFDEITSALGCSHLKVPNRLEKIIGSIPVV